MRKFGISVYPDKSDKKEMMDYIDRAEKYGFSRMFLNLLAVSEDKDSIKKDFSEITFYAKDKGFEIIADVNHDTFKALDITYDDLSFFKEIKVDGIRLDQGYSGLEESLMTFNKENLLIEVGMSSLTHGIDTIMDYMPNKYNLVACHNFYPHAYTGLSVDHFINTTKNFNKYGIRTAAFVTSQNKDSFGPWPVTDGLPTLEIHRNIPMDIQAKHLIAMGDVEDIIISNCYPSELELKKMGTMTKDIVTFNAILENDIPEVEKDIVNNELHFNRGDVSGSMIRSTQSRVKHKGHNFKVFNTPEVIKRGDIVIESSLYGHYAGEMQIALKDMKNAGKSNVVGRILEDEIFILDYIKPWQKFRLKSVDL